MRSSFLLLVAAFTTAQAQQKSVTTIGDGCTPPRAARQAELRATEAWKAFLVTNPSWRPEFDERTALPRRAYGKPIATVGNSPSERAHTFLVQALEPYGVEATQLEQMGWWPTPKHTYIHFRQRYQGLHVLFSHALVKLDAQGRVVLFGADLHPMIDVELTPTLSATQAQYVAMQGLGQVLSVRTRPELAILPVPKKEGYDHRLVFGVQVTTTEPDGTPGEWRCWVDAQNGQLHYRRNEVLSHGLGADEETSEVSLTATADITNPNDPQAQRVLAYAQVIIGQDTVYTDENGYVDTGIEGPVSATIRLEGSYSKVTRDGVTPEFSVVLAPGQNALSFDANAELSERSAYCFVNEIHDHMKGWMPTFTGMDESVTTRVELGLLSCNASYEPSSNRLNFYRETNDCASTSRLGDVVFHEYGHGINHRFYQQFGETFENGGMNEGYADWWGLSRTLEARMGEGIYLDDPQDVIRRYDQDPKVYPDDVNALDVHGTGEVICGAWWDTYLLLGSNMDLTQQLFVDAYAGLQAIVPAGQEGTAFRDVLLDALQADDDDGDLTNGTPNGAAIAEGFAKHGIYLYGDATFDHEPIATAAPLVPIALQATLETTYPYSIYLTAVELRYRTSDQQPWTTMAMDEVGPLSYAAEIPAQPAGTIVQYYLSTMQYPQAQGGTLPANAADQDDASLPFFVLVGYELLTTDDAEGGAPWGAWSVGLPTDDANDGLWELGVPIGSVGGQNDEVVQTEQQHTIGGTQCYYTANGDNADSNPNSADVDGGVTTLVTPPIAVSGLVDPVLTYWRWFSNATPGSNGDPQDPWRVDISDDGSTWTPVEITRQSDRSWRRNALRISDLVSANGEVWLRFIAEDDNGNDMVEAALDDVQLWGANEGISAVSDQGNDPGLDAYPVPCNEVLVVRPVHQAPNTVLTLTDASGRAVRTWGANGAQVLYLPTGDLANGSYTLRAQGLGSAAIRNIIVMH
jgi:Fungalysin metallopeptidase (M36)